MVYWAIFIKGNCKVGDKVFIFGIGGGVVLFVFQFVLVVGVEVYVILGSVDKLLCVIEMGVKGGVNYREEDWYKILGKAFGGFDFIIDSVGGLGFVCFFKICNFGVCIVIYGGMQGKVFDFFLQFIFWK